MHPDFDRLQAIAALLASTSWLTIHRIVMNQGFLLRMRGVSTDTAISLAIGMTSTLWLAAITWPTLSGSRKSITEADSPGQVAPSVANLAKGPILTQTIFLFWLLSWVDGTIAERRRRKAHFWSLVNLQGPFDWTSGLRPIFYWALSIAVITNVGILAIATLINGNVRDGALNLAGAFLFIFRGTSNNPYVSAPHHYAEDRLRIALPTSHHEGTVYVLPGPRIGFDAVWSPKIDNEYLEADNEIMVLFEHMRSGTWSVSEPLERLRATMALFYRRTRISTAHLTRLADWIYLETDPQDPVSLKIACERAPGVHLIGRDLMYALCHAEYLVFMGQAKLSRTHQAKLGTLRHMSRSGAAPIEANGRTTVGYEPGFDGYREAVQYVYSIFGEDLEDTALRFQDTEPPKYSSCLQRTPLSIEEYVSELWDKSCENSESTFSALYFFTTVWFVELGNVNGFHIFPLRVRDRNGDLVSQQIVWRQIWYSGIIAQLIAVSPTLFMLFVFGYLG